MLNNALRRLTWISETVASTRNVFKSAMRASTAPGLRKAFTTRASSGLEMTYSNSGTTLPVAVMTYSMGPESTLAVRMRARAMIGLSLAPPQTSAAATSATTASGSSTTNLYASEVAATSLSSACSIFTGLQSARPKPSKLTFITSPSANSTPAPKLKASAP